MKSNFKECALITVQIKSIINKYFVGIDYAFSRY